MFEFREIENPKKPGQKIVQILHKGDAVATLYPTRQGFKIVSKLIPPDPEQAQEAEVTFWMCYSPPRLNELLIRLTKLM